MLAGRPYSAVQTSAVQSMLCISQKPKRKPPPPATLCSVFGFLLTGASALAASTALPLQLLLLTPLLKRLESALALFAWHTLLDAASYTCKDRQCLTPDSEHRRRRLFYTIPLQVGSSTLCLFTIYRTGEYLLLWPSANIAPTSGHFTCSTARKHWCRCKCCSWRQPASLS